LKPDTVSYEIKFLVVSSGNITPTWKLVHVSANIIATGKEAGIVTQGRTEEELEKRLGALLFAGDQIAIDNCTAPLGGAFLCALLTQSTVMVRILGKSEVVEVPTDVLATATGNNLRITGT
jgi:hypothetical protein